MIYSLTEDKPFEYFILLTIFVNCILLAANTPLPENDKSDRNIKLVSNNFSSLSFLNKTAKRHRTAVSETVTTRPLQGQK